MTKWLISKNRLHQGWTNLSSIKSDADAEVYSLYWPVEGELCEKQDSLDFITLVPECTASLATFSLS